ncbi:hypothetical protein RhiJN_25465 [Ceratobasidium sp. AG-Ba]|nr:hypothetical protein RhiJN_25465 [Ceratobasidium sp. AG-Ba]
MVHSELGAASSLGLASAGCFLSSHKESEFSLVVAYAWLFALDYMLAIWVTLLAMVAVCIVSPDPPRINEHSCVEDQLERVVIEWEQSIHNDVGPVAALIRQLQSLVDVSEPMPWASWPWDHLYRPIKQHSLALGLCAETKVLKVTFPSIPCQSMSVSEFQKHLLNRVRLHSECIELLGLGVGTTVREEMEDKMSQTWSLLRHEADPAFYSTRANGNSPNDAEGPFNICIKTSIPSQIAIRSEPSRVSSIVLEAEVDGQRGFIRIQWTGAQTQIEDAYYRIGRRYKEFTNRSSNWVSAEVSTIKHIAGVREMINEIRRLKSILADIGVSWTIRFEPLGHSAFGSPH